MPFPNPATQFKPGQSGNPGGRPKAKILTGLLGEMLASNDHADAKAVIFALVTEAKRGSIAHIKEVFDRTEGKVADNLTITGNREAVDDILDEDATDPPAEG